jgi:hypothetical protein
MKEINLTRGQVTLVDDEDYEFLNQWKWFVLKLKDTSYALRHLNKDNRFIYMHRLIMNTPDELEVDHIDHNGLNNQKYNLRNCTHQQNLMNHKITGKSKYIGVSYNGKYIHAKIRANGKQIHLGNFKTEIEAALVYDQRAKEIFGEYANLNFKQ